MTVEKNIEDLLRESIKSNNPSFIFLAGSAGTGKTTLLKEMRRVFKDSVIVAPTGAAAINCDLITEEKNKEKKLHGITIHSFFKFYKAQWSSLERLSRGKNVSGEYKKVFEQLELLIIDEISMVSAPLLDGISNSLIKIRKNPNPFGGLTILAAGDLYQLPPVIPRQQVKELKKLGYSNRYFFSSLVFKEVEQADYFQAYKLKENYRQDQDEEYFGLLEQCRKQENIEDVINQFNSSCLVDAIDKDVDLILGPKKDHVLSINEDRLGRLEAQEKTYFATKRTGRYTRIKDENLPAPAELKLKVGARVMMIKNDTNRPQRWVNGTTGVIKALESNVIRVKIGNFNRNVARETWEEVKVEHIKETGEFLEVSIGDYKQFPITLGWAVTIHKAQGQTLDTCVIDLRSGTWDHGQLYVALSRCKKLKDLKLTRSIQKSDCHFDPEVTDFLDSLDFKELNNSESRQTDALSKENSQTPKNERVIDPNDMILEMTLSYIIDLSYEELRKQVENSDYDEFNKLREKLANENGKPFFHNILKSTAMLMMMITKPRTEDDFLEIPGIGPIFIENYLKQFSDLINKLYPESEKEPTKEKQEIKNSRDKYTLSEVARLLKEAEDKETLKEIKNDLKKIKEALKIDEIPTSEPSGEITSPTIRHKDLLKELKMERKKIATEEGVPAYVVAPNQTLEELAEVRPSTLAEMHDIWGFGDIRLEKYGQIFLDILNKYRDK